MATEKQKWPEVGDLVIATVENVTDYGAYVKLDEFGRKGLLHISEVSSSWIRNLRDFVREGQKVVLKVLRVDADKGHIDVSLRRVTKREKIEKIMSWKMERKAETLIRGVSEKAGLPVEEVHEKIVVPIEKELSLYEGLEKAAREGPDFLIKMGAPENLAKALVDVVRERIKVSMVKVKGIVELRCMKPNGVRIIKEAFLDAKKTEKIRDAKVRFYVVAAPKYAVEVMAENYKRAEDVLQKFSEGVVSNVTSAGGQGSFRR